MQLSSVIFAVSTLLYVTLADSSNSIIDPTTGTNVVAGNDLSIKWTPSTPGPISLQLRFGSTDNLTSDTQVARESNPM